MKAQRGFIGKLYPFFNFGARKGWVVKATPRPLYSLERAPVVTLQEARLASGPVWKDVENFAPTGFRTLNRPAGSNSLFQLRYPGRLRVAQYAHITELFVV